MLEELAKRTADPNHKGTKSKLSKQVYNLHISPLHAPKPNLVLPLAQGTNPSPEVEGEILSSRAWALILHAQLPVVW